MSASSVFCWIFLAVGILFIAFSAFLYYVGHRTQPQQNKMLYHPEVPPESREVCESPVQLGIANSEDVSILTADGFTLRGFMLWPDQPPSPDEVLQETAATDGLRNEGNTTAVTFGEDADAKSNTNNNNINNSSNNNNNNNNVHSSKASSRDSNGVERCSGGTVGTNMLGSYTNPSCGPSCSAGGSPQAAMGGGVSAAEPTKKSRRVPSFVLLYFHGNAGNVGHRLGLAEAFVQRLGCLVVMVDYRGFGLSSAAVPSQEGLEMDAEACLDFMWNDPRIPKDRIFVMGTSLGGAVTIHLAAKLQCGKRIKALIIENTFTSISDMTTSLGQPLFEQHGGRLHSCLFCVFNNYVKPLVLKIRWRSVQIIGTIHKPMLFLSGLRDELIPPSQMRQLFTKAEMFSDGTVEPQPFRQFVEFPEGMHNNLPLMSGYFQSIKSFVDTVLNN